LVKNAELPADTKDDLIDDLSSIKKASDREEPKKNVALAHLDNVAQTLEKMSKTLLPCPPIVKWNHPLLRLIPLANYYYNRF
jgi:predicted Zn-ribbon and HTH transcriptional regulator